MARALVGLTVALLAACSAPTEPSAAPSATPTADGAKLTVTGSGFVCGPWWYGCGAILTIASPGSKVPMGWAPGDHDTWFKVGLDTGSEGPYPVTGVIAQPQDRLQPGSYQVVVVMTRQSDVGGSTMSPSFGCSSDLVVATGTLAVHLDVRLGVAPPACTITVSRDR